MDLRTQRLAKTLVHYSAAVEPGHVVLIRCSLAAQDLALAIYEEVMKADAHPVLRLEPSECSELFYAHASERHLSEINPYEKAAVETVDALIHVASSTNTHAMSSVDPARQAQHAITTRPLKERMLRKNWVISLFPTNAYAQDADMSLREFEDFVYSATYSTHEDPVAAWRALSAYQAGVIQQLKGARTVQIRGRDTDLSFSIAGRTFLNSDGKHNMPSGEVFTGPVEDSANGKIRYDFPVCHNGREVDDIQLVFKDGEVVEAGASKNQDYLLEMLDMDPGARRLGELGIGTNFQIQRFIKNILFDEKIGGTIHLALGSSYPETGGKNRSSLHWDMIKDLRADGELLIDGRPFVLPPPPAILTGS